MAKTKRVRKKRVSKRRYSSRKTTRKHSKKVYRNKNNRKKRSSNRTKRRMMGGGRPIISPNGEITGSLKKAATGSNRSRSFWRTRNIKIDSGYVFSYKDGEELKGGFNLHMCTPAKLVSGKDKEFEFDEIPLSNDRKGWFQAGSRDEALEWIRAINMTTGIGGIQMSVQKINPSYLNPAFKDDDGRITGIRIPEGTIVIAFTRLTTQFPVHGQGDVEYTLVSHEGNLGYIAKANLLPVSVASGAPGTGASLPGTVVTAPAAQPATAQPAAGRPAPGSALASAPVAASVPSSPPNGTTKNVEFYSNQLKVEFKVKGYDGKIVDTHAHTIDTFHETFETKTKQNYAFLEKCHNYIQWLFPTKTHSRFNPDCFPLTDGDIVHFKGDQAIMNRLHKSFEIIADFYGFVCDEAGNVSVGNDGHYEACMKAINNPNDHNFQRISRILECLGLMGLFNHRQSFYEALTKAVRDGVLDNGLSALPRWTEKMAIA